MTVPSPEELFESAARWQRQALGTWSLDKEVALAMAGVSAEHLLKAVLCSLHPTLIVDAGKFDSLLGALKLSHLTKTPGSQTKTISAAVAWQRIQQVHVFRSDIAAIDRLIEVRNGALHLGSLTGVTTRRTFNQFLRLTEELRGQFNGGQTPAAIWGDWKELVEVWLAEDRAHIERDVEARLSAANQHVRLVLRGTPPESIPAKRLELQSKQRGEILQFTSRSDAVPGFFHRLESTRCPTVDCRDDSALGIGWTHYDEVKSVVNFHMGRFSCGVCGLSLPSPDHLMTAELPMFWAVDDEPPIFELNEQ